MLRDFFRLQERLTQGNLFCCISAFGLPAIMSHLGNTTRYGQKDTELYSQLPAGLCVHNTFVDIVDEAQPQLRRFAVFVVGFALGAENRTGIHFSLCG